MAEFAVNTPIQTKESAIEVTISEKQPLAIGRHRFQLIVTDDSGNKSKADVVEVIVADTEAPTAVLAAPRAVPVGKSFELNGEKSFDIGGGQVIVYEWSYLGPA